MLKLMTRQLARLFLLLIACRGIAFASPEQWIEIKSNHFTVLTDANENQGRQVLDQFERMRWMFQTLFPKANVDPADPIQVIATKNYKVFQSLEPAAYLTKGQLLLGGLFLKTQDKNYILLGIGSLEEHPYTVVYHEYTHLQFSSAAEGMPLWLDEGLAEFIQNTDIRDKDVHLGQVSADDIRDLRQNQLIPLTTLFKVDINSPYYHEERKGSVFYAESWALTHYIEVNDKQKHLHQMDEYMALLKNHEDPVAAAEKAFGELNQLQSALEAYIHAGDYKEFILSSASASLNEASYRVRLVAQTEIDAIRADFLACVGRDEDAIALADTVIKADPTSAQAYETKGYIAFRNGDHETARKWYAEAVKQNSKSYLANYYYAAISPARASPEDDIQVETSLRTAIHLNPRFAPAYDQLAIFFAQRQKNLEEAHRLSLQAIDLDRGNFGYRLNASTILMAMGKYADAANTLQLAAGLAKTPREITTLKSNLQSVQSMQQANTSTGFTTTTVFDGSASDSSVEVKKKPRHSAEPLTGPRHELLGIIRHVQCSSPSGVDFQVESTKKIVALYSSDYFKRDLSALGFEPKAEMNICTDIEGMKARVQYAESIDKAVDGQVISIELRK